MWKHIENYIYINIMLAKFLLGLVIATVLVLLVFAAKLLEDIIKSPRVAETYYINRTPDIQIHFPIAISDEPLLQTDQNLTNTTKNKTRKVVKSKKITAETTAANNAATETTTAETVEQQPATIENTEPVPVVNKQGEYLESIQKHANDPQNVHDTQIVKSLSIKYRRLMELHNEYNKDAYKEISEAGISIAEFKVAKINRCMDEFREYTRDYISSGIRNNKFRQSEANEIVKKISIVMKEILKARTIVSLTSEYEIIREDWIFALIWEHINTTSNVEIQANLRESFILQIIECSVKNSNQPAFVALQMLGLIPLGMVNDYSVVCINGRVGRMLSSMTLIDNDPVLGAPEKDEAEIANEIYTKVFKLFEDELNKQPDLKKLYISGDDSESVTHKIDATKTNIINAINKEYNNLVPENKLTEILNKAIAGI